jgi:hypothetical protein
MRISLWCATHSSIVTMADDLPLATPTKVELVTVSDIDERHNIVTEWTVQDDNFYCTGGVGDHKFEIITRTSTEEN